MRARTDEEYFLPPTTPVSAGLTLAILGCLYLVIVEIGAALLEGLSTLTGVAVVVGIGVAVAFDVTVGEVRRRVAVLRSQVVAGSSAIGDATPGVEATTRRLAQQADSPLRTSTSSGPIDQSRSRSGAARTRSWSSRRDCWRP